MAASVAREPQLPPGAGLAVDVLDGVVDTAEEPERLGAAQATVHLVDAVVVRGGSAPARAPSPPAPARRRARRSGMQSAAPDGEAVVQGERHRGGRRLIEGAHDQQLAAGREDQQRVGSGCSETARADDQQIGRRPLGEVAGAR